MNKNQSSNTHLSKYVFILPAVVIASLIFGISKASENKTIQNILSETLTQDTITAVKGKKVLKTNKESTKTIKIEQKKNDSMALIDTLKNGAPNTRKLGDFGKGNTAVQIKQESSKSDNGPLYVIDGKIQTSGAFNLNPNSIKSINVLKNAPAIALYGDKGKHGVVLLNQKRLLIQQRLTAVKQASQ